MAKSADDKGSDFAGLVFQSLKGIQPTPSDKPTEETDLEARDYKDQELTYKNAILSEQVKSLQANRKAREKYTGRVYWLIVIWLISIIALILFDSLEWLPISDNIMLALIGGTTINVLGLFHFVLKYLFDPISQEQ